MSAILLAALVAVPITAVPMSSGPVPLALVPQADPDYPIGTWRMFHANPEHTGEGVATLPPLGHVVWRYPAPPIEPNAFDKPEGGAVVDGDVVFASLGSTMMAFNATSGGRLWSYVASGRIFSTPAVNNGVVYFASEASDGLNNTYALDEVTGLQIWAKNETRGLGGGIHFIHGSPAVVNGLFYIGSYTYRFYARHASNGTLAWYTDLASAIVGSPAVSGDTVYVASAGIHNPGTPSWDEFPRLWAFNATTGQEQWNQTVTQGHLFASPVVAGGVVYAATAGFSYFSIDVDAGYVVAFDAATGSPLWTSPDVGRMIATPAVSGSTMVVAGAGDQGGGVTGTTARLRWLDLTASGALMGEQPVGNNASMESSPAIVGSLVVAAARDGTVAVFLNPTARMWEFKLPQEIIAPVAVDNDMVFVPSLYGALYAFGAQPDFAVDAADVVLTDSTPHAGQPTTLQIIVENVGDKKGSGVASVEVNQGGVVTPVATWNVTDLDKGALVVLRAPVRLPSVGDANFTVTVSGVAPFDGNSANDVAVVSYTVLPPLAGWQSRYADAQGSNFLETQSPQNNVLLWRQTAFSVLGGGFAAYGGTLVFADSAANRIMAVPRDRGNDTWLWMWNASAPIVGSPLLVNGYLAVATAAGPDPAGNVSFLDADTGALVRTVPISGHPTSSGVSQGDSLFFSASDRVVELSVDNLTVVRDLPAISVPPASRPALRAEPLIVPGWAFVASSVGELHAFNLTTGTEPAGWPVQLEAPTALPLVAGGGFLFAVNGAENVSAFSLAPLLPVPVWNTTLDGPITGAMGLGYGRLFVPTATNVTALVAGSGSLAWNRSLSPAEPANAIRAAGNATVFAGASRLLALSASTGDPEWTFDPGADGAVNSSAALYGGTLHVQTASGRILTLGLVPGRPPTAVIDSPMPGVNYRAFENISFSSVGTSDPDNETLNYLWDFGDGNTSTNANDLHAYGFAGDFRVRLTVTDGLALVSTVAVDVHVIVNAAPTLTVPPENRVQPEVILQNLDTTVWTFKVRYFDPDGDPPVTITLNISNETDPTKALLPVGAGPYNFSDGVDYQWVGALSSGNHSYRFEASDGLASAETPTSRFPIYRVETRDHPPELTYSIMYVGAGISEHSAVTGIVPPAGFGAIDRFSVTLPANASNILWILLEFRYGLWIDTSDFLESTIAIYARERESNAWIYADSVLFEDTDTVIANISAAVFPVFTVDPVSRQPTATFGVFGKPVVAPLAPLCEANSGAKTLFAPGERITFSAADSVERNGGDIRDLAFSWEFDDGTPLGAGVTVEHNYSTARIYEVRLTAVNSFGQNCTKTLTITVRSESSTSTFLWLAALIVGALFAVAVAWPVTRRRSRAEPPRDPDAVARPVRERPRPAAAPRRSAREIDPEPDEHEQAAIDAVHEETESGGSGNR